MSDLLWEGKVYWNEKQSNQSLIDAGPVKIYSDETASAMRCGVFVKYWMNAEMLNFIVELQLSQHTMDMQLWGSLLLCARRVVVVWKNMKWWNVVRWKAWFRHFLNKLL